MATIEENLRVWDRTYEWKNGGAEWSEHDGVAFLHHSNLGAYSRLPWQMARLPGGKLLRKVGLAEASAHWRARTVDAGHVLMWTLEVGLTVVSQERVNWGTRRLIDCMTVVTRPVSRFDRPALIVENARFMQEAAICRSIASTYGDSDNRSEPWTRE